MYRTYLYIYKYLFKQVFQTRDGKYEAFWRKLCIFIFHIFFSFKVCRRKSFPISFLAPYHTIYLCTYMMHTYIQIVWRITGHKSLMVLFRMICARNSKNWNINFSILILVSFVTWQAAIQKSVQNIKVAFCKLFIYFILSNVFIFSKV